MSKYIYNEVKNYIHNELKLTKEDIKEIMIPIVKEEVKRIFQNTYGNDVDIEMRVRRKLTDEELKNCRYPYPYDTEYLILEFDDIGVSNKVLCLGVTSKNG